MRLSRNPITLQGHNAHFRNSRQNLLKFIKIYFKPALLSHTRIFIIPNMLYAREASWNHADFSRRAKNLLLASDEYKDRFLPDEYSEELKSFHRKTTFLREVRTDYNKIASEKFHEKWEISHIRRNQSFSKQEYRISR